MKRYILIMIIIIVLVSCTDQNQGKENANQDIKVDETSVNAHNHLSQESSPYLLQHADNPVNWYPYSQEALEKAKKENKLIFLSIGYSTCHWCHVMARESFEDQDVASILNQNYIAIKVDREERPDIDSYYMNLFQQAGGSGGWPLNIILTADQEMFFGLTYMPKESENGRPGLIDTLTYLQDMWVNETDKILDTANNIKEISKHLNSITPEDFDPLLKETVLDNLKDSYDDLYGGFSVEPKFPTPHYLNFLLNEDEKYWPMVYTSLDKMIQGGIYDQLAGGLHRYTIDRKWQVPHFEKMLYDQAQLMGVLAMAYRQTENEVYKETIYSIIDFVDIRLSDGSLYYAGIDAETDHEEGKHYLWTVEELKAVLEADEYKFVKEYYNINEKGNYLDEVTSDYTGKNILFLDEDSLLNISKTDLLAINEKLLKARDQRAFPHVDKKILTDWNAMYINSLLQTSKLLNDAPLQVKALDSLAALENNLLMFDEEIKIYHSMIDATKGHEGFLDDYAYLLSTYIEAYKSTYDTHYLDKAIKIANASIKNFWHPEYLGFMYSNVNSQSITMEKKYVDAAYPTGYSLMIKELRVLGYITANTDYYTYSSDASASIAAFVNISPFISLTTVDAVHAKDETHYEIVIVEGDEPVDGYIELLDDIQIDHLTIIVKNANNTENLDRLAPYTSYYTAIQGKTTVFICQNATCQLPVSGIEDFKKALEQFK